MGLLRLALAALLLGACYSPDLAECTVSCASDGDCGGGQVCTSGLCAAEGATCNAEGADAAVVEPDAPEPDAALPQTQLRLRVMDQGSVTPTGKTACTMELMECRYSVDVGVPLTLTAEPEGTRIFEKWDEACAGQMTNVCTLTPMMGPELKVTAKFKKID
jgi:hypothetical protein